MNKFVPHVNPRQRVSTAEKPLNQMEMMIHIISVNQPFYQCLPNGLIYKVITAARIEAMHGLNNMDLHLSRVVCL